MFISSGTIYNVFGMTRCGFKLRIFFLLGKPDEALPRGATISHVTVVAEIVGTIRNVQVRYTKNPGGFLGWGGGSDTISVHQMEIESGDNGHR